MRAVLPTGVRVYLCTKPLEMRKSFDGLIAATRTLIGQDPLSGHRFVFVDRRADYAKCLYCARGGYCLWAKRLEALREQLEWFKRQVFGVRSEKRPQAGGEQAGLFCAGQAPVLEGDPAGAIAVPAHTRRKVRTGEGVNDSGLRFGADVPVREIVLPCPELDGPHAGQYELIDHKVSLRLARQPGSHVVLKYLRPVVRRKADGAMTTVAAPLGVLDHAQVDVSFVAGMLVDKFVYHVPLYRQHQRLAVAGAGPER